MAALHFIQGVVVLIISKSRTFPVTTNYLTLNPLSSSAAGHPTLVAATRHLFDFNIVYLIAAFFFISAIAHVYLATSYRSRYESDLKKGINRVRWIEYGFSAGLMMVAIAFLSGAYDLSTIIMIFSLTLIMNLLGLLMEAHNQTTKSTNWLSYVVGCFAGVIPWIVFVIYVIGSGVFGGGNIPAFVYWIYVSMFICFSSFAVNMYLQYKKKGKWADYLYGERAYMILSLVAKTLLAWQVFAGILRP
jgi:VanZ family protein